MTASLPERIAGHSGQGMGSSSWPGPDLQNRGSCITLERIDPRALRRGRPVAEWPELDLALPSPARVAAVHARALADELAEIERGEAARREGARRGWETRRERRNA